MNKRYSNQNHFVNRTIKPLDKTASIYDKQAISNRVEEKAPLTFSSLAPYEAEAIYSVLQKDAAELNDLSFEKKAGPFDTPFDIFAHTKNYIASRTGVSDEVAHDMASSVVSKGEEMRNQYGGELQEIITGIVDNMDSNEIRMRTGIIPRRSLTKAQLEETVKEKLMSKMNLSSFDAERVKMNVIQQARNLSTQMRNVDIERIADAIIEVLVEYNDISAVYDISTSDRLINDVKAHLNTDS